jgi:AraC-like DNA-binding protein
MLRTDKNFLDISLSTGFSDPKYFNQYFKRLFGMTPKQIKRSPDWKEAILNYFNNEGLEPEAGKDLLTQYLEKNQ